MVTDRKETEIMYDSKKVKNNSLTLPVEVIKVLKNINKKGTIPLYVQLIELLKEVIEKKEIKEGDFFATESLIQRETKLSRSTVRKSLEELVRQNYLIRITGKGTFVSVSIPKESVVWSELKSMSQELEEKGMTPGSIILNVKKMEATKKIREKLKLDENEEVLYIERIRTGNGIPILYVEGYISLKYGDFHINEVPNSLYEMVKKNGVNIQNAEHIIGASNISSKVSKHLGVEKGIAGITMERITFDSDSKPVIYETGIFRSDLFYHTLIMQEEK